MSLVLYSTDFVSNIKTYEYRTQNKIIEVNMICNERIILSHLLLSDLITQENILFFSLNEYEYELNEDNEVVKHELKKSSFYSINKPTKAGGTILHTCFFILILFNQVLKDNKIL